MSETAETVAVEKQAPGFDILFERVIGRVTFSSNGKQSLSESAFAQIGKHLDEIEDTKGGKFTFPGPDGDMGETVVTVGYSAHEVNKEEDQIRLVLRRVADYQESVSQAVNVLSSDGMLTDGTDKIALKKAVVRWLSGS